MVAVLASARVPQQADDTINDVTTLKMTDRLFFRIITIISAGRESKNNNNLNNLHCGLIWLM
ncbi:MAG: hypothetical protein ACXWC0_29070, partial [Burkholderiales bacterium]